MDKILLLHNSPRVRRYFQALAAGIPSHEFVVRRIGARWRGSAVPQSTIDEIIDYGLRRKRARPHYGSVRLGFFRRLYSSAAQLHFKHAVAALEEMKPGAVGVWGGNALDAMAVVVAARQRGTPCFRFENGFLPNTTQMDLQGVNVASSVPRDPKFYRNYGGTWKTETPDRVVPRKPHRNKQEVAPITLPARYVFVPFQVQLDSQVLLHSPWLKRMDDLFDVIMQAVARVGAAAPDVIFKEHPSCPRRYPELHQRAQALRRVQFANGNATGELIGGASGIITINSSVGIESLLLGKPVLALGNAVYEIPGVTASARTVAGIADWLGAIARGQPPAASLREPFLRFLAQDFLIPDRHQSPGAAHFAAVAARFARIVPPR